MASQHRPPLESGQRVGSGERGISRRALLIGGGVAAAAAAGVGLFADQMFSDQPSQAISASRSREPHVANSGMLIGASTRTLARAERYLGTISCGRGPFYSGLPTEYDPTGPRTRPGLPMFVSFSQLDDNTAPYALSCPSGTRLIWKHEAETGKAKNGLAFVDEYTRAYDTVKSANADIQFGVASASSAYRPPGGGRSVGPAISGSWLPDPTIVDFYGIDTYQQGTVNPEPLGVHKKFQNWYQLVKDRGVPLGITEYGINTLPHFGATNPPQDAARAALIPVDYAWLKENDFTFWMYWYDVETYGHPSPTREFVDDRSSAAWKRVVADNQ